MALNLSTLHLSEMRVELTAIPGQLHRVPEELSGMAPHQSQRWYMVSKGMETEQKLNVATESLEINTSFCCLVRTGARLLFKYILFHLKYFWLNKSERRYLKHSFLL